MLHGIRPWAAALALLASAACVNDAARPTLPPDHPPVVPAPPRPIGVYEITMTGIGGSAMRSTVTPVGPATRAGGPSPTLTVAGSGLVFEQIGSASFTEGSRTGGGQRYISFTYRVRNSTGASLNNITLLAVEKTGNISGTPISSLLKFDGTAASSSIASLVVPTGQAAMRADGVSMEALYADVLQVFTESEVAAITRPSGVTDIFPYGYVIRSANPDATTRTIPNTSNANQFDGVFTLAIRVPLQSTSSSDVFSITFQVLAVTDSQTRLTESVEEGQDTAAVRRLRARAAALGVDTVTVLNGSPVMDPSVEDYSEQRQICSFRTAGTAASPVTTNVAPAAYMKVGVILPSESLSSCGAFFRSGSPAAAHIGVAYAVKTYAMDRYGNVKTAEADTVTLARVTGPSFSVSPSSTVALTSGLATFNLTYSDWGTATVSATGRRNRATRGINILP